MKLFIELGLVFFAVCAPASLVIAGLHRAFGAALGRFLPQQRARLRFISVLAPVTFGVLSVIAALLPSLLEVVGLGTDHCANPREDHHAHLCFIHRAHGVSALLTFLVLGCGAVVAARAVLTLARHFRAQRVFAGVLRTSRVRPMGEGAFAFDSEVPLCVTTGLRSPRIYISSGAIAALGDECVDAALAHERGHLARGETRARFVASVAEAFHLPWLGKRLLHEWQEDAEFICDAFAARAAGSGALVAEALVSLQAAIVRSRAAPLCSGANLCSRGTPLTARVTRLLSAGVVQGQDATTDQGTVAYGLGLALLILGISVQAVPIHHALEAFVARLSAALM